MTSTAPKRAEPPVARQVEGAGDPEPERVRPIVLANPASGPTDISLEALENAFPAAEVRMVRGEDLEEVVADAATSGPPWIGVCGGDGSQRTAAAVLADGDVPLLVIPGGTRNHFARELGLETIDAAADAARSGRARAVDIGEVNGEIFLNNASIGFYAAMVRERARQDHRPKRVVDLLGAWEQARRGHRFPVVVDGVRHRAWLVFVGNGCYSSNLTSLGGREAIDAGVLDVRLVLAERRLARTRTVLGMLLGRVTRSPVSDQIVKPEVEVDVLDVNTADVALDGEVTRLLTPLRFRCRAGALRVLVPAEADGDG